MLNVVCFGQGSYILVLRQNSATLIIEYMIISLLRRNLKLELWYFRKEKEASLLEGKSVHDKQQSRIKVRTFHLAHFTRSIKYYLTLINSLNL